MKRGTTEREVNGRRFTDVVPEELARLVDEAGFEIVDLWKTDDVPPGRNDVWVNAISRAR